MPRLVIALFAIIIIHSSFLMPNCFAEATWQSIGPFGGIIETIAIDTTNSQTVYAGTDGGVYKSTNGGASWIAASSGMMNTNISSLAIDPTNSQTVYAGTYGGVFKSTNGGASWTTASSGMTETYVMSLAIDPTSSQTVYAGTINGWVFKSTNGGASWTTASSRITGINLRSFAIDPTNSQTVYAGLAVGGVYKSTNGGASWTEANSGLTDTYVRSLAIDPTNGRTVYVGTWNGVFKSTNGGASWTAASSGMTDTNVQSFAIDQMNSQTVYVGTNGGVFKSTNGGASWTEASSGMTNKNVLSLAIDPTNNQMVYAGTYGGVFKSSKGGASWTVASSGITNMGAASLAIDPTNSQTVYAGTSGAGVCKSTNGGASWTVASSGMTNTDVSSLAIDPTNSQTVYTGTYDGVFKSTDGGASWTAANGVMTIKFVRSLAIGPTNSRTVYAGTLGGVFKSTNGCDSWTTASSGIANTNVQSLAIDPTNSQTVYAGTNGGVFKSTNSGDSWTAASSGITTDVRSLAIDPTNNQTVYAGTSSGVFKSTNGGDSWIDASSGMTDTIVQSLAIDPTNSQTVYAGTWGGGGFKSTNGGASWTKASSRMTDTTVYSLAIDPTNSQTMYAGTDKGVFKTLLSNDVPAITGSANATFSEGVPGTFTVTASGWPAPQFSISGTLPSGVSFDTTTGILSGIPASGSAGTYPLIVTATNGIPPDATKGLTLTVRPVTSLAVTTTSPSDNAKVSSLSAITGTASGSGISKVEIQITDGTYYLQSNGSFALTPSWLTASGATSWTLNTGSVTWREGITYTIQARASSGSTSSAPSSSTFTIVVSASKTSTIISLTLTPDTIRAGDSATISGLLSKADTTAVSGQPITLIITPPSTAATPNPSPIISSFTTDSGGTFTTGTLSNFAVPGVYMVQARFEGNSTLASSFASEALAVTPQSGYAVIISGKTTDNSLLDMHTASTDAIYSTLVNKRGFLPENIQYLKSTTSAPVSRQQIQDAITVWARNKLIASPAPLYIIMIDHGSQAGFLLGTDTLTPDQLKGYLDNLESDPQIIASGTLTTHNRIIMIGTCYSGIFAELSKPGRIVIISANIDEQSIAGFSIYNSSSDTTYYGGEYFIDNMFSYLGRGDTLKDAFIQSSTMVGLRDPRKVPPGTHAGVYDTLAQHPLLDDNGDAKASYILGTDGLLTANLRLGVGVRSLGNPADIAAVTETTTIPATQTTDTLLWLRVNDNSRIAKAWMEIRTPITTVTTSTTGQVIPRLITLPLYYDGLQWNGSYSFPNAGTYNILYYTQDNQTSDIAPAKNSVVYKQMAGNTPPASFNLISPNDAEAVSPMFPLTWQGVTSPNKITYTLQVATDQNFVNVVYKEESIPQAATYIPKNALKKPGTNQYYCQNGDSYCYWKVTAIDSFGATSNSNTRSFTIVSTSAFNGIIVGWITPAVSGAVIQTDGNGSAISLSNGYFLMNHIAGTFTLTVTANGYNVYSTSVKIDENAVTNVTIPLTSSGTRIPGDLDGDGAVTVADAIIALQVMAGMQPDGLRSDYTTSGADVSGDGKVGLPEALYILQKAARVR